MPNADPSPNPDTPATVAEFARELVKRLREEANIDAVAATKGFLVDYHKGKSVGFETSISWVRSLAARHGVEMEEKQC